MAKDRQCKNCGHKWKSRTDNPKQCPKCHKIIEYSKQEKRDAKSEDSGYLRLMFLGVISGLIVAFLNKINLAEYSLVSFTFYKLAFIQYFFVLLILVGAYFFDKYYIKKARGEDIQTTSSNVNLWTILLTLATIGLVIVTCIMGYFTYLQSQTLERQAQILEEVSIPNTAKLFPFLTHHSLTDYEIPSFEQHRIVNAEGRGVQFDVKLQNIGRFDSGSVHDLKFTSEGDLFYFGDSDPGYIANIEAGQTWPIEAYIKPAACRNDNNECNESYVPLGKQDITLKGICSYCQDKDVIGNFKICIYRPEHYEEDC